MKRISLLLGFCLLICSQNAFADIVSLDERWVDGDLRSFVPVPFFVENIGNALHMYSCKMVEGVTVCLISATGSVYCEKVCAFSPSDCICVPLDGWAEGEYTIEFSRWNGHPVGDFSVDKMHLQFGYCISMLFIRYSY